MSRLRALSQDPTNCQRLTVMPNVVPDETQVRLWFNVSGGLVIIGQCSVLYVLTFAFARDVGGDQDPWSASDVVQPRDQQYSQWYNRSIESCHTGHYQAVIGRSQETPHPTTTTTMSRDTSHSSHEVRSSNPTLLNTVSKGEHGNHDIPYNLMVNGQFDFVFQVSLTGEL